MNDNRELRKQIVSSFRFNGLSTKGDACDYLISQLLPVSANERAVWLEKIVEYLQKKNSLVDPVVEKIHVVTAIEECCKVEANTSDDIINVIDIFTAPRFNYSNECKKYFRDKSDRRLLFDSADSRVQSFLDRYILLKQRIERNELISSYNAQHDGTDSVKLRSIDYLLSYAGKNTTVVVFGLLSQLEEGKYCLEGPDGMLPLDLSQAIYHNGIFAENCFILAEGVFTEGILHAQGIAMPPPEASKISRSYFGNEDTFNSNSDTSLKSSTRLLKIEKENEEAMIVFLADVWLDHPKVLDKLRVFFSGYNEYSPTAIVLMGNFLSKPYGSEHSRMLRNKFQELAELLTQFENLVRDTLIIIVPGPNDSPFANILPSPSLPAFITEEFTKRIPKSVFATNPARIQYCTQEIVVFREDIFTKICRNCIRFPEAADLPMQFVKTILSQSYLVPVPMSVCPIYWNRSDALTLNPLPDVLVIADQRSPFSISHKDCVVFNPSSFPTHQYSFKVYIPSTKQVEDSQITAEAS